MITLISKLAGRGIAFKNRHKQANEKSPDYRGDGTLTITLPGQEVEANISIGIWKKHDKYGNTYLTISIGNAKAKAKQDAPSADTANDVPF